MLARLKRGFEPLPQIGEGNFAEGGLMGRSFLMPEPGKPVPATRLLSVREAAGLLNVHEVTLYRWLAAGALPSTKLGRRRLVAESTVQAIIARAEVAE